VVTVESYRHSRAAPVTDSRQTGDTAIVANQRRHKRESGSKSRQNSYRKSFDAAGQNPHNADIQQPGKAGDFGNDNEPEQTGDADDTGSRPAAHLSR
jgi:hypothetical protein